MGKLSEILSQVKMPSILISRKYSEDQKFDDHVTEILFYKVEKIKYKSCKAFQFLVAFVLFLQDVPKKHGGIVINFLNRTLHITQYLNFCAKL